METFIPRGKVFGPILPQFILETPLTFGAKIMYALLCNYASEKDHCWPSQATLAAKLSCSLSSVKNYLAELTGEKLIAIRRGHACCVYYLLRPTCIKEAAKPASLQPGTQPKADPDQPKFGYDQPKFGCINNLNKQEEKENPPLPPAQTEPVKSPPTSGQRFVGGGDSFAHDFEKAWDAYPKKAAVGLALSA